MKRQRKVYGMPFLVEKKAILHSGGLSLHVHFQGGAMTEYGVTPAKYTTDDTLHQSLIENSKEFQSGVVVLLAAYEVDVEDEVAEEVAEETSENTEKAEKAETTETEDKQEDGKEVMTFSSLADAKVFLVEEKGVGKSLISSKAEAIAAGAAVGITVVFDKKK